jgi:hypothetical protein
MAPACPGVVHDLQGICGRVACVCVCMWVGGGGGWGGALCGKLTRVGGKQTECSCNDV